MNDAMRSYAAICQPIVSKRREGQSDARPRIPNRVCAYLPETDPHDSTSDCLMMRGTLQYDELFRRTDPEGKVIQ